MKSCKLEFLTFALTGPLLATVGFAQEPKPVFSNTNVELAIELFQEGKKVGGIIDRPDNGIQKGAPLHCGMTGPNGRSFDVILCYVGYAHFQLAESANDQQLKPGHVFTFQVLAGNEGMTIQTADKNEKRLILYQQSPQTLYNDEEISVVLRNKSKTYSKNRVADSDKLISDEEPFYKGKSLSEWIGALKKTQLSWNERDAYEEAREAIRAIGPQAVPFLLNEFEGEEAAWNRACAGFLALGELGESAVAELFQLVEKHPGYAPLALAAIGGAAVPSLRECLKNDTLFGEFPHALIPGNTMGGIHNAITVGRIPASQFYPLLPTIQKLSKSDNPQSVFYAKSLLKTLLADVEK